MFRRNLGPTNDQNRFKIDAKTHSILDSVFWATVRRCLLPTSTPETELVIDFSCVFFIVFEENGIAKLTSVFGPIFVPT